MKNYCGSKNGDYRGFAYREIKDRTRLCKNAKGSSVLLLMIY